MKTTTYKAIRTVTTSWVLVSQFSFQDAPLASKPMSETDARALEASTRTNAEDMGLEIVALSVESREIETIAPVSRDEYEACVERAGNDDYRIVPEIVRTVRVAA